MDLCINPQGIVRTIYHEAISLQLLGTLQITRASHVEPDAQAQWWADLSPSHGPRLGPFPNRSEALQAEHDWLSEHVLFSNPSKESPVFHDPIPSPKITPPTASAARTAHETAARHSDLS